MTLDRLRKRRTWLLLSVSLLVAVGCSEGAIEAPASKLGEPKQQPFKLQPIPPSEGRFFLGRIDPRDLARRKQAEEIERLEALGYATGTREPEIAAVGVTVHERDRAYGGFNFYVSGHDTAAYLTDMDGRVLHKWNRESKDMWPEEESSHGSRYFRRAHLFENGDILAIYEGVGLAKLDVDSNVLWFGADKAHHALHVTPAGDIYVLTSEARVLPWLNPEEPILEDWIVVLDENGEEKRSLSVVSAFRGTRFEQFLTRYKRKGDFLHTNAIEVLDGSIAHRVAAFAAGNLLISMRDVDALAVIDANTEKVIWMLRGLFTKQHDPRILANGKLLLFDNGSAQRKASRVLELEPKTWQKSWKYSGTQAEPFFSRGCGTAARLPNGNTLIAESDNGRALEVDSEGEIVWEFRSPHRTGPGNAFVATLFDLVRVAPDFPIDWATGDWATGDMATAAEPRAHTVFAAVGHLSSLKGKEGKLRRLAHELNDRKPDYVFVLGDMTLNATDHETKRFQRAFLDELDAPYYIAAGNHDLARARRDYKTFEARFGPRFLMVEDPRAHFVVIDTNAHIDRIEAELGEMFARAEEAPARPTILLTHHMIWRDYKVRRFFYKSTDILALLEGRVKAIIAGDHSSGFRRATVRGIDVYSVGMGKRGPFPLYIFTIGTVDASGALDLQSFPFKPQKDAQAAEGRL